MKKEDSRKMTKHQLSAERHRAIKPLVAGWRSCPPVTPHNSIGKLSRNFDPVYRQPALIRSYFKFSTTVYAA